jgi:hypothetical protein
VWVKLNFVWLVPATLVLGAWWWRSRRDVRERRRRPSPWGLLAPSSSHDVAHAARTSSGDHF